MSAEKWEEERESGTLILPDVVEPVVGVRAWRMGARLGSIGVSYTWSSEGRVATHIRASYDVTHECPGLNSECGFWIVRKEVPFMIPAKVKADPSLYVVGSVKGWGRVYVYEYGWRCQYAKPLSLFTFRDTSLAVRQRIGDLARMYGARVEHKDLRAKAYLTGVGN